MKFFHWNLNGLAAHNFAKVPLIEADINTFDLKSTCSSETFLYLSIPFDDQGINFKGYSLLPEDHPTALKDGCMHILLRIYTINRKERSY